MLLQLLLLKHLTVVLLILYSQVMVLVMLQPQQLRLQESAHHLQRQKLGRL